MFGDSWTRELVQAYREILGGILENELDSIFCKWASLIAQLVKNPPAMQKTPWVGKICWERDRLPTPVFLGFPGGSAGKKTNPPAMQETWVWSLGWEDPQEKGKATHSSILAWRIPWTIQSMGMQRVGHDWVAFTSLHFMQHKSERYLILIKILG